MLKRSVAIAAVVIGLLTFAAAPASAQTKHRLTKLPKLCATLSWHGLTVYVTPVHESCSAATTLGKKLRKKDFSVPNSGQRFDGYTCNDTTEAARYNGHLIDCEHGSSGASFDRVLKKHTPNRQCATSKVRSGGQQYLQDGKARLVRFLCTNDVAVAEFSTGADDDGIAADQSSKRTLHYLVMTGGSNGDWYAEDYAPPSRSYTSLPDRLGTASYSIASFYRVDSYLIKHKAAGRA